MVDAMMDFGSLGWRGTSYVENKRLGECVCVCVRIESERETCRYV
jgi:hypothetical protein